jgi:hypothetical protein
MTNAIRGVRQPIAGQSVIGNPGSVPAAPTSIPISALAKLLAPLIAASQSVTRVIIALVPVGANPTATAGPAAVNGTAKTFMRSDAAPAVQVATTGQKGLVEPDGTTIGITAGVISVPVATTGQKGLVEPDGTTIGITAGVISAIGGGSSNGTGLLVSGDTPGPAFITNGAGEPIYVPL